VGVANLQSRERGLCIGGQKWYRLKEHWWVPIGPLYRLFLYQHSFARNFRLEFWVGCEPQSWGRGGHRGSGMVPFERALVSSYRPSIVTFPLSLHVSEILPLLCSSTPLSPHPTSIVSPKFSHAPLGFGGWPLGYEAKCWHMCWLITTMCQCCLVLMLVPVILFTTVLLKVMKIR